MKKRRGFTLIEATAATVILAVGIAAVVRALGDGARAETRMKRVEEMTRLAQHKYEELVATSLQMTAGATQSGDFSDENIPDYQWTCDIEDTTVTNLESVVVTVTMTNDNSTSAPVGKICTLLYIAPQNSTGSTVGGAGGTGAGGGGNRGGGGTGGRG